MKKKSQVVDALTWLRRRLKKEEGRSGTFDI